MTSPLIEKINFFCLLKFSIVEVFLPPWLGLRLDTLSIFFYFEAIVNVMPPPHETILDKVITGMHRKITFVS